MAPPFCFRDTAHVFDEFAPQFADRFHVLALTRRGFGESVKPPSGYDARTRVEDIRQFLDALGVSEASLVGHSMAGDELTLFATRYPRFVRRRRIFIQRSTVSRRSMNRSATPEDACSEPSLIFHYIPP